MSWGSLNDFLNMGGYGLYVWGSYIVTAALLAFEAFAVARRQREAFRTVRRLRGGRERSAR